VEPVYRQAVNSLPAELHQIAGCRSARHRRALASRSRPGQQSQGSGDRRDAPLRAAHTRPSPHCKPGNGVMRSPMAANEMTTLFDLPEFRLIPGERKASWGPELDDHVIEFACGTGLLTTDAARRYYQTQRIGTMCAYVVPGASRLPSNPRRLGVRGHQMATPGHRPSRHDHPTHPPGEPEPTPSSGRIPPITERPPPPPSIR
jgi:hypothetical protein